MKIILKILFVFLIFTTSVHSVEAPRLILYFDINKTLIASDKAGNKSIDNVLNELLAEAYEATWDENDDSPITFEEYATKITDSREDKKALIHGFIDRLREQIHPLLPYVLRDYLTALTILESSEENVFPSFYYLLNFLEEEQIPYSIVLRSFGEEVIEVKEEIERFSNLTFVAGKFRQGTLMLENKYSISDPLMVYQRLKEIGHAAIQDDWSYWNAHHEASAQGKPFYVDPDECEILPIFFDDNIHTTESSKNIIAPLNPVTGELIPIEKLVKSGQAVRVDTWEAIVNPYYYIDLVKKAMKNSHEAFGVRRLDAALLPSA